MSLDQAPAREDPAQAPGDAVPEQSPLLAGECVEERLAQRPVARAVGRERARRKPRVEQRRESALLDRAGEAHQVLHPRSRCDATRDARVVEVDEETAWARRVALEEDVAEVQVAVDGAGVVKAAQRRCPARRRLAGDPRAQATRRARRGRRRTRARSSVPKWHSQKRPRRREMAATGVGSGAPRSRSASQVSSSRAPRRARQEAGREETAEQRPRGAPLAGAAPPATPGSSTSRCGPRPPAHDASGSQRGVEALRRPRARRARGRRGTRRSRTTR